MREGVLFEVTKNHLEQGLKGVPVGYCTTSYIDSQKGIFYVGRPLTDLVFRSCEEIIYLLFFSMPGTPFQVKSFFQELQLKTGLNPKIDAFISSLPRELSFFDLYAQSLGFLSSIATNGNVREDCLYLLANLPYLVGKIVAHQNQKNEDTCDQASGYFSKFLEIGTPQYLANESLNNVLERYFILHLDEGGGFLPAFVGKCTSSGGQDVFGSLSAAMYAMKGLNVTNPDENGLQFTQLVCEKIQEDKTDQYVEEYLKNRNETQSGFGSDLFSIEDPRASICYGLAQKLCPDHALIKTALLLRKVGPIVFEKPANEYAIMPSLAKVLGLDHVHFLSVIRAFAASIGIIVQIYYDRVIACDGLGTCKVHPTYIYKHRL